MLWASLKDFFTLTIPNKIPFFLILLFGLFAYTEYLENSEGFRWFLCERFLIAGASFIFGIIIWHLGLIGGGDVKLFAALSLWFELKKLLLMIIITSLLGGVMALLLIFLKNFFKDKKDPQWLNKFVGDKTVIPYGVAICLSAVVCFVIENYYKI